MNPRFYSFILLLLPLGSLWGQTSFTEVSAQAGINHIFQVDLATFGGGAAVIDYDRDGWEDLYVTGGNVPDRLYHNLGNGTFEDVHPQAGFDRTREIHTQGVASADINRDGYPDLVVTTMSYNDPDRTIAPNLLYLNQGNGTFLDVTAAWGLENLRTNSMSASFGDVNADGFPDLFIANYYASAPSGISLYNGTTITNSFSPDRDYLFLNAGGRTFFDASQYYGLNHEAFGFEGLFTDYDNDRDLDLLILNDFGYSKTANLFYQNQFPDPNYLDRSESLVMNYGMNAMGIAACDVNFDGWMDYFVTNLSTSLFAVSDQNGTKFRNMGEAMGLAVTNIDDSLYQGIPVSWGANFFDYDQDTDMDLFVCNGALNPDIRLNPNLFFEFQEGQFVEVSRQKGLFDYRIGRGSVVFDYDNDGDMDLFVVNQEARNPSSVMPPARCLLYRNDAAQGNWLKIELEGVQATTRGIGARIEVIVGGKLLVREIYAGDSHMSQNSTIAHFGLGNAPGVERITVKWPGGHTQSLPDVAANQYLRIVESPHSQSFEADQFAIFPTHFEQGLSVKFELGGPAAELKSVAVFSADGRKVDQVEDFPRQSPAGFFHWEAPVGLGHGLYLFRFETGSGYSVAKAIKI